MGKEEHAIILDFLPNGYPFDKRPMYKKTPVAQAIGQETMVLLELVPKKDIFLQPHEVVYIGADKRDKVHHISKRLRLDALTLTAQSEVEHVVNELIKKSEAKFVDFFNSAGPLNMRIHQLELLPGIGKKHMLEILREREEKPFTSFEDIKIRVKLIPNPEKTVQRRIIQELEGNENHYLFIKG